MAKLMDLPVDVLIIIFLRFPAKLLMQFKSVCKLWNHIILSPHFISLHFDQTLTLTQSGNSTLRFVFSAPHLSSADFDTFDHVSELDHPFRRIGKGYADVVGSCHGLLCLYNHDSDLTILLYNPTTRTHKKLPFLAIPVSYPYSSYFGFGYDSVSRDFKFVRILKSSKDYTDKPFWNEEVMVYSLRADSWTRVGDFPRQFSPEREDGVFIDGNLHWVHGVFDGFQLHNTVINFNLSDHKFGEVPQPHYEEDSVQLNVGVLDGCLCLLANDIYHSDIWVMKEYGLVGSWKRFYRVSQQNFGLYFQWPIAFSANRQELFLQLSVWRVVSLDLKTMEVKDVRVCDFPKCFDTRVCMENLMMLKDAGSDTTGTDSKNGRKRRRRRQRPLRKRKRARGNQDRTTMPSRMVG